ncbi:GlsB/YeaQ/YmgE family stress response membrane protein [Ochrovirga pacifica]|uniref:GlsB/YeaQ/YmgE family stress response membrane protein n=1 Tax=Ochrovirga pacifica TaxID=1042376 RepID=UPI0002559855|nr:hypothetical protein [Ochrovirga pacifica]
MDFFITILLAGLAGWLANLLYTDIELSPIVYFFIGIIGGVVLSSIFKLFDIPFLNGYFGDFVFSFLGALLVFLAINVSARFRKNEDE